MKEDNLNTYLNHQKQFFEDTHHLMTKENHSGHNSDPEYWNILLKEIKEDKERWKDKNALDFGCGCGRNLVNLSKLAEWKTIDGCDISKQNANYSKEWFRNNKENDISLCETWETNGMNIQPAKENYYDFIMSHIVFQHIYNYNVRYSIMSDMYNSLKENGLISLHFMDLEVIETSYYDNSSDYYKNSRVDNPEFLIKDFQQIGFKNVTCDVGVDFYLGVKSYYIKGSK